MGGSKCSGYMALWCGLYDVPGQFNSTEMCCVCGGGRYVEEMYNQVITGAPDGVKAGVYDISYKTFANGAWSEEKFSDTNWRNNMTLDCDGTVHIYWNCAQSYCGEMINKKIITDAGAVETNCHNRV